ncbi:MAG: murein biosynthesis integral membrane protein MurJ [Brevinemataceae bacterium]
MRKNIMPFKNTLINVVGTFLSRVIGIVKFNVVNYLFGSSADTFHSANANILTLRKVLGEGPIVNAFLPIFSKKNSAESQEEANKFASNIINQLILISLIVIILGMAATPLWTKIFLPGFKENTKEFNEIVSLTSIMLLSTIAFSVFSLAMGILNSHERFLSSSTAPIFSNIVFIVFPLLTFQSLGILSLGWAVVLGTFLQLLIEVIELALIGFKYYPILNFKDPSSKNFWKLFFPTAGNYLAQSGISIGLGFFASFLPRGSITYLRNTNTILIAPVGFIGVAISSAIFPIFAKFKSNRPKLAQAWFHGFEFFLFCSIPIAFFFSLYPDVIVNIIFRDISLLVSGSTGKYSDELQAKTIQAVQILGTVIIPWSLTLMINKLFYSLEKPKWPLIFIIINFVVNIFGYMISRKLNLGGLGLIYSDLIAAWITLVVSLIVIIIYLPELKAYYYSFIQTIIPFILLSGLSWLIMYPLYQWYIQRSHSAVVYLLTGSTIFGLGILIFGALTYLFNICPILEKKSSVGNEHDL